MIIHRTTAEPDRKALHRAAKARQHQHPARPIPPPQHRTRCQRYIQRARAWLGHLFRDPAPVPPAGAAHPCPAGSRPSSAHMR